MNNKEKYWLVKQSGIGDFFKKLKVEADAGLKAFKRGWEGKDEPAVPPPPPQPQYMDDAGGAWNDEGLEFANTIWDEQALRRRASRQSAVLNNSVYNKVGPLGKPLVDLYRSFSKLRRPQYQHGLFKKFLENKRSWTGEGITSKDVAHEQKLRDAMNEYSPIQQQLGYYKDSDRIPWQNRQPMFQ